MDTVQDTVHTMEMSRPADGRRLVLVLGGARSGKSRYGERLARALARGRPVLYLATAEAGDAEMRARIARHRAARPAGWLTIEEPLDPAHALAEHPASREAGAVLLDCVTLLTANHLPRALPDDAPAEAEPDPAADAAEQALWRAVEGLLAAYRRGTWSLVLVSNEVGMGLVPPYPLGRAYRDLLGRVNARLARASDAVVLLVAGLPLELKALSAGWEREAASRLGLDAPLAPDDRDDALE